MKQQREEAQGIAADGGPAMTREQGHAFRNIFSIIVANAEMIGEEADPAGPVQRRLERIIEAARRGEELVGRLRHAPAAEAGRAEPAAGCRPQPVQRPGRVLVVDDEVDVVEIISRFLRKAEMEVLGVTDPRQALELFSSEPAAFDLVITDLDMPFLSGAALCQRLQTLRPGVPILLITGYDRQASCDLEPGLGIRELLVKPLSREHLLTAVRRNLTLTA